MPSLVSIVVPTYNRNQLLCDTLDYLLRQDYPHTHLIVVDQSADHDSATWKYLEQNSNRIEYVRLSQPNLPAARNVGIARSQGEVVVFCDDDMVVPPDTVSRLLQLYRDPKVWGATVSVFQPQQANEFHAATQNPEKNPPNISRVNDFNGGFMSYRKELFDRIGGFDEWVGTQPLSAAEDFEFSWRATVANYGLYRDAGIPILHLWGEPGGCSRQLMEGQLQYRTSVKLITYAFLKNRRPGLAGWLWAILRSYHAWIFNRKLLTTHPLTVYRRHLVFAAAVRFAIDAVKSNQSASSARFSSPVHSASIKSKAPQ
jgi:GT2 family glycosyltransferase